MITAYQAKYFAHELTRRHSAADSEKLAGALADAQVDINPHQVDAALFAFKSPLSKGAILADEVGLGKTIEAGLVLSQKWTEGKRRILIIVPASLRKQWVQEMQEKFFLPAMILEAKNYNKMLKDGVRNPFEQKALVVCSYHFAARHAEELMVLPWDLAVIDEAHRLRNVYKTGNKIGRALKGALANVPKVLLTATPLQNSLMELYGLVSIVDDHTFGDAKSFRAQYSRLTGDDSFTELKARLGPVCHRTLRHQVKEHIRFTNRLPITREFVPSKEEQTLYDMVSEYLRRPSLYALPKGQRTLMILILRKLLASSTFAIAGALDSLVRKLEKQLREDEKQKQELAEELAEDYEGLDELADEWAEEEAPEPAVLTPEDVAAIQAEIDDLKAFRDLAVSIAENARGKVLLEALESGFAKAAELGAALKAIIFTESRRTQDYLFRLLSASGYEGQVVLFSGTNTGPQAREIYARWKEANRGTDRFTGSYTADQRAALVDHFHDQAQIMIATEAAAEGINLQFCSMVVNYDLPWNPQRIEQRIGRCHRYGQKHDVVVVNFLNKNNAADQRVYQLLDEKFQLFSGVFGASDEVLGAIESGVDFEKRIVAIYQNCRTQEEIETAFAQLREELDTQIAATMEDTRRKLLENFDAEVHDRLRINLIDSGEYLGRYDTFLWEITRHGLDGLARFGGESYTFEVDQRPPGCPEVPLGRYRLGREVEGAHRYRLGHPLAQHVIQEAAGHALPCATVEFGYTEAPQIAARIAPLAGRQGVLAVARLSVSGADAQDHLLFHARSDDGQILTDEDCRRLLRLPAKVAGDASPPDDGPIAQALEARKSDILREIGERQAAWFDEEIEKLDKWADDRRATLKGSLKDLDDQLKELKRSIRASGSLPDKLELQRKAQGLEAKRDVAWREYDEGAREIEREKETLLDQVEARLKQEVTDERLFVVRWAVT